ERYLMTVASSLLENGFEVNVFWDNKADKKRLEERLGINLERVNFVDNIFKKASFLDKNKSLAKYDLIFYLSDGSLPFLFGKKNIIHFQVPFHNVNGKSLANKIKLSRINKVVCNSFFTKGFIDKEFGIKSSIVYPPVDINSFKPLKKENIILNVARFTTLLHNKRQDVLVESFKRLLKENTKVKDWKLILAGGAEEGKELVARLKKISIGYPIEIITNPQFNHLKQLYGQAKIFWTAAGFGFDELKEPEKMEHFGITTVEAMAAGCVPLVINKGGQKEIVKEGKNGLLWEKETELIAKTLSLMRNEGKWQELSKEAQKRSKDFSEKIFFHRIREIIK
ncbi:MAG: glycosyltransferase family 4 protein, partial [Candidatus Shapirobacteria bacterium]|nr:glycosyltransferase family 4 protein [Candidatus Shapirobacteria bacterium]